METNRSPLPEVTVYKVVSQCVMSAPHRPPNEARHVMGEQILFLSTDRY